MCRRICGVFCHHMSPSVRFSSLDYTEITPDHLVTNPHNLLQGL